MTYRISTYHSTGKADVYQLANDGGDLARTTEGGIFLTEDYAIALAAREFLNLDHAGRRAGPHWLKSTFGTI